MRHLGVVLSVDTWHFFQDIFADLKSQYEVDVFQKRTMNLSFLNERANRLLFRHDFESFLKRNEVVFFEWASEFLMYASVLPKRCGIVTRLHRFEMYEWADRINWDGVDRIILVSRAKQREFVAKFPNQSGKVVVLPPSIPLGKFSPGSKPFSGDIGILCHLSPRKRVYDLILAFYELRQRTGNFHLHIGGRAEPAHQDYYTALVFLIKELGLQNDVTMYGNVRDTSEWYRKIDIFVSNSYSEGLQVAPMEAMASGCYCLSHYWDGADELLPLENLFFTNSQLLEKVLCYSNLSDSDKSARRQTMLAIARDRFDIKDTIAGIRKVIEETATAVQQ